MNKLFLLLSSFSATALLAGEITVLRQFNTSIQAVTIPAGPQIKKIALYAVKNKQADKEHPLPVKYIANQDGSCRILFKVDGIGGHGMIYSKVVDGIAYDTYGSPKTPPMLGPIHATYEIDLNASVASPVLDATDSNLVYNGNFEKANAQGDFADGFFWQNSVKKGYFEWVTNEGHDGTNCIRIRRKADKGVAAFSERFLVQGGKTYTFGGNFKCDNPDKKYVTAFIQCYDKESKPINTKEGKIYCYTNYATADWTSGETKATLPAETAWISFNAELSEIGPNNTLWADNLFLKCEDIAYNP